MAAPNVSHEAENKLLLDESSKDIDMRNLEEINKEKDSDGPIEEVKLGD